MLNIMRTLPPLLNKAILNAGLSLENTGYSQLVHAAAEYSRVTIRCYDKDARGIWRRNESLGTLSGFAGRNGVSATKQEGDGCSPAGLYQLGYAFGSKGIPDTKMAYRAITADSFWVDDPHSRHYNTWVEGTENADWESAECLSSYKDYYAYAIVIEYNTTDRIPGKGSAVFFHCGDRPTSGCIAIPEAALLKVLKWLDPDKTPGILITSET